MLLAATKAPSIPITLHDIMNAVLTCYYKTAHVLGVAFLHSFPLIDGAQILVLESSFRRTFGEGLLRWTNSLAHLLIYRQRSCIIALQSEPEAPPTSVASEPVQQPDRSSRNEIA